MRFRRGVELLGVRTLRDRAADGRRPTVRGALMPTSSRVNRHRGRMRVERWRGAIRQTHMDNVQPRLRLLGALGLLLMSAACGGSSNAHDASNANGTSNASCVGPYLNDQPPGGPFRGPVPTVSPGATITIYGHWYTSTCNDTGGHDPLKPLPPVHLTLSLPGGDVQELGEFNPNGQDMGFSASAQVPAATKAGTAMVRDDQPYPATYEFKVGQ